MSKNQLTYLSLAMFSIITMLGVTSWMAPNTIVPLQESTLSPTPTEDSWVIVELPEDASQLEYGEEVYRLVCKACHGDIGWGLTDEWRAQWEPKDQNCWQSKCHGDNHPVDGFYMPGVPAVVGEPIRKFGSASTLYTYNRIAMPYHDRGNLTDYEAWAVTAYILKINGIDPPPVLSVENAADISLSVIDPNLGPTPTLSASETQPAQEQVNTPTLPAQEKVATPTLPASKAHPTQEQVYTPTPVPAIMPDASAAESNDSQWIYLGALIIAIFVVVYIILQRRNTA